MGRPPKKNLPTDLNNALHQIGLNLLDLREDRGLSQSELARQSGVSLTTINEIETRKFRDIRISTLSSLAATLKVPLIEFFRTSDIRLSDQDQARLLKASEAIWRISKKLRS